MPNLFRNLIIGIITSAIATAIVTAAIGLFKGISSFSNGISIWYFTALIFVCTACFSLLYLYYREKIKSQRRVFIISASMVSAPFFAELVRHLVSSLELLGYIPEIRLPQKEYDTNEINRHVKYVINNRQFYVGGFLIYADPESNLDRYRGFVSEFKKPVIFLDSGKSDHYDSFPENAVFAGYDNDKTGIVAAKYAISILERNNITSPYIKIIASGYQKERQQNFQTQIKERFPQSTINIDDTCEFNRRKAYRTIYSDLRDCIAEKRNFWDLIFCTNDEMAIGVSQAIADINQDLLKRTIIIGVDGIIEALDEIDKGNYGFRNTVNQSPESLALTGVDLLVKKLDGTPTKKNKLLGAKYIYKNILKWNVFLIK